MSSSRIVHPADQGTAFVLGQGMASTTRGARVGRMCRREAAVRPLGPVDAYKNTPLTANGLNHHKMYQPISVDGMRQTLYRMDASASVPRRGEGRRFSYFGRSGSAKKPRSICSRDLQCFALNCQTFPSKPAAAYMAQPGGLDAPATPE